MTRSLLPALACAAAFAGCAGDDCELREATGFFETYRSIGCSAFTRDFSEDPSQALGFSFGPTDLVTFTNAPDEVGVRLVGAQYPGRRGTCTLYDVDAPAVPVDFTCDYRFLSIEEGGRGYRNYTVEIYRATMDISGQRGTFAGVFRVQLTDSPGASP
jgi:hypothetical protein